ncbi:MAG: cytidylate kinase-like family protein [Phycisphaerales bacterium]|nr:MAG: cytidylate kinase-like family protein [Phycisphaerales bacterium]
MSTHSLSGGHGLDRLVEKQMRNWELARAQRLTVPKEDRKEVEDFIAISRLVAAGGKEVAAKLGEALGWPVFDKEILDVMAGDDTIRRQVYDSMDERDLGWYEEVLRSLAQSEFVRNDYFNRLTQTVLSISRQGHGVYLGRAADLILPRDRGLRVRLVAPFAQRVQAFADQHKLSADTAKVELERVENERAEFAKAHFGIDYNDPTRCDLTINLDRLSITDAVGLILTTRERLGRVG